MHEPTKTGRMKSLPYQCACILGPSADRNRCPHTPRTSPGFSRCFLIQCWSFTTTGISVFELLHPDDHALTAAALTSVTGKEVGRLIDVRIQDAENRWRHCEIRGRSIDAEDGGDPSIIVGIRDTADRQGLEFGSGHTDLLRALAHSGLVLAKSIATRIREAVIKPIDIDGRVIRIDASIGTSVAFGRPTPEELLATADETMYPVKRHRNSSKAAQT